MKCPACQRDLEAQFQFCPGCGAATGLGNQPQAGAVPNPYSAPIQENAEMQTGQAGPSTKADATGGVIPYNNPKALIAYYLGIFSGLPLIGLPIGITAVVLGILGFRDFRRNPEISGRVHASIGIGCGGLFTLIWTAIIASIIVGLVNS